MNAIAPDRRPRADASAAEATFERIGRIVANSGRDVLVLVESSLGRRPNLSLGDILLVETDIAPLVGIVSGIKAPAPGLEGEGQELWVAQLDLVGTLRSEEDGAYVKAVERPPALGAVVIRPAAADLSRLFRNESDGALPIGTVVGQRGLCATIDPDLLTATGFGILGTASSGKSSTLACLVRALLRGRFPINMLLLDPYDEFGRSFGRAATVVRPTPGLFPHWLLSFEELCYVLSCNGGHLDPDEASILEEAIPLARQRFVQRTEGAASAMGVSVDGPVPYRVTDIVSFIDSNLHSDESRSSASYRRLRIRLLAAATDPRLSIIFGSAAATDSLGPLLSGLFRLSGQAAPPLTVLQLGSLTAGLDKLVASVVCRMAAAVAEWSSAPPRQLILIEDAERFAPTDPGDRAAVLSAGAIKALLGRARKLGTVIGFTAISPRAVSRDLLAKCGTYFLHRLPAAIDVDHLDEVLPEAAPACLDQLGTLGEREAVAIGHAFSVPGRLTLSPLPRTAIPGKAMSGEDPGGAPDVDRIVRRWRLGGNEPSPD